MGHMKYGYGGMDAAHGHIGAAKGKLHQIEGDVEAALTKLRGAWTGGSDLVAYNAYQNTWDRIFQDVHTALAGLQAVVGVSKVKAAETESVNTRMFSPT